jgi:hypothetical protein
MPPRVGLGTARIPAKVYYENISEILSPEYRNLDAENVRLLLEQSNIDAEYMEGFLDTLKNLGKTVVNAMPQVLPVAAPILGGIVGGPAGAAIGQMVGGLAGRALSPSQPAQPSVQPAATSLMTGLQNIPSQARQMPGGSPAASQLAQLLYNPKLLQSLMAMVMGQAGAPNISVGSKSVPPSAFTNLLGQLANQATAEYNAMENVIRPHRESEDYAGERIDDPTESAIRANRLLEDLQEADLGETGHYAKRLSWRTAPEVDTERESYDEAYDEAYDEMLLTELYSDLNNWG